MHEYLLFSQVAASRHQQVSSILAGVTGSQPCDFQEEHILYQPLKAQQAAASKKNAKQQQQQQSPPQLYMHDLTRAVPNTTNGDGADEWKLVIRQIPEPGQKNVITRVVTEDLKPKLEQYADVSLYARKTQYLVAGQRFVFGNVVIRLSRLLVPSAATTDTALSAAALKTDDCKVVDPSGAYIVEALVRVEDRKKADLDEKATKELLGFQRQMEGALDLRIIDRLALDTRVRV